MCFPPTVIDTAIILSAGEIEQSAVFFSLLKKNKRLTDKPTKQDSTPEDYLGRKSQNSIVTSSQNWGSEMGKNPSSSGQVSQEG